ncbi:MAG: hypothetical protein RL748_3372, partial [Pseudomonadota bacterium]
MPSPSDTRPDLTLDIEGMSCAACATRIEKALNKLDGVARANVNFATEHASVHLKQTSHSAQQLPLLLQAIEKAGYDARPHQEQAPDPGPVARREGWFLAACALLTLPLVLPMLGMLGGQHWVLPASLQWLLASPVQFVFGARFYRGAWAALRAKSGNMDLLVALGT